MTATPGERRKQRHRELGNMPKATQPGVGMACYTQATFIQ